MTEAKFDILSKLQLDAGRAYQENVRLYGEAKAKAMHDESNRAIAAVAQLVEACNGATCQCPRAHLEIHQKDCHLNKVPAALEPFLPN